ncbi:MAG: dsDNA nuclease domain-containing protein [Pirellulaceae bacterium]
MAAKYHSIHDLPPLEIGGVVARYGFAIQDHVAAGFCLDMLDDPMLSQVWCETQDDVTLIWTDGKEEKVEFVQVKSNDLDQLWTIAKLLEKEKVALSVDAATNGKPTKKKVAMKVPANAAKPAQCILEKSLQYDRCFESVSFRIVTCQNVKSELKVLTYNLDSTHRSPKSTNMVELVDKLVKQVGKAKSAKGNGCAFWAQRAYWVVIHSLESIRKENLWKLKKLVEAQGAYLAADQIEELYERLLTKVFDGGLARWDKEANKKKILRSDLLQWFARAVQDAVHPGYQGTGKRLEEKLKDAGIPEDQYESIAFMRLRYRSEGLTPKYAETKQRNKVEGDIAARLHAMRANLDGRVINDDGVSFHAKCINVVDEIHGKLPESNRPPIENLFGYMYNLSDRCTHRFVRAKS